jgi:hypothetical protein
VSRSRIAAILASFSSVPPRCVYWRRASSISLDLGVAGQAHSLQRSHVGAFERPQDRQDQA